MKKPIYFDYSATTPVDPRVAAKMTHYLTHDGIFGNPASRSHAFGWEAERAVEEARANVAAVIRDYLDFRRNRSQQSGNQGRGKLLPHEKGNRIVAADSADFFERLHTPIFERKTGIAHITETTDTSSPSDSSNFAMSNSPFSFVSK